MIKIISFGYGHAEPPAAHFTFDLRELFKDPHVSPTLRGLTGTHPEVIRNVFRQRGAEAYLRGIITAVFAVRGSAPIVAFGCVGGRHRSVVFANALAIELQASFRAAPKTDTLICVEHRDISKPVLVR